MSDIVMCSECFQDQGLKYEACLIGNENDSAVCPICGNTNGKKLTYEQILLLCDRFFVSGTYEKTEFGGASMLNVSERGSRFDSDIAVGNKIEKDIILLYDKLGIGIFYAAPQMWKVGLISWLEDLAGKNKRKKETAIRKFIARMTSRTIGPDSKFYRMRTNIRDEILEANSYDAPPSIYAPAGRLNTEGMPVLYAAFDIETCIHECRATINDTLFLASIKPLRELKLLDFTEVNEDSNETSPFEDLSIAIKFLFTAGSNAYPITQALAAKVQEQGYDGIIYSSFFNQIRDKDYKNIALFGRPVEDGKVFIDNVNRLMLNTVQYQFVLGPAMDG